MSYIVRTICNSCGLTHETTAGTTAELQALPHGWSHVKVYQRDDDMFPQHRAHVCQHCVGLLIRSLSIYKAPPSREEDEDDDIRPCPHGVEASDCDACFRQSDHAFDAAREGSG